MPTGAEEYVELPQGWFDLPALLQCAGPDPAVSVRYELIEQLGPGHGRVRIIATIESRGHTAWASGENQQLAMFFEGNALLESRNLEVLALDETIQFVHEVEWWTSDEFRPPAYRIVLSYDPDIYIDDNPLNDDCDQSNNDAERPTSELDALVE